MAFFVVLGFERGQDKQHFDSNSAIRVAALQSKVVSTLESIHSLQSFYSASQSVSRHTFRVFAEKELAAHSAIQALEWVPKITADELDHFEASVQSEGFPNFKVFLEENGFDSTQVMEKSSYFPVAFVEPYAGNESALGFDLSSNQLRSQTLEEARDTGGLVTTQHIVLVQEIEDQFGFIVFAPVYQNGLPARTVSQRQRALNGFVVGVFQVNDLVNSAWVTAGLEPISEEQGFFLFDRSLPKPSQVLMRSTGIADIVPGDSRSLEFSESVNVGGRDWEAVIISPQRSVLSIWQSWSALLAGLGLTSITVAYLMLAIQREARTQLLVEQRTRELSEANDLLQTEALQRTRTQLELTGLYEISRILSAGGDFQTKATAALEKLAALANADWVTLRLPNDDEPGLHLIAAAGPEVANNPPLPIFTNSVTANMLAFGEGQTIVINEYSELPAATQQYLDMGMNSMVLLPIKSKDRTLGLVNVISKNKSHFGRELVELLSAVGDGLGVLLENSILQEETEKAHQTQIQLANENAVLAEIGSVLGSSLHLNEGFGVFAEQMRFLIPFDQLDITVIHPSREYDEVVFSTQPNDGIPQSTPLMGSITERVTSGAEGMIVQDLTSLEITSEYSCLVSSERDGLRSWLIMPLVHNGAGIGALFLASTQESAFSQNDLDITSRVAHHISGAISNASHHARQMEAEDALREREARLRGIVESAADGIITIDEVGIIESFNSGAEAIFGYASSEVVGCNVKMLMPAPDRETHDSYLNNHQHNETRKVIGVGRDVLGRRKNGAEFPIELSISMVELGDRKIHTGIIRDITESRALQAEKEERAKELEIAYTELQSLDRMKDEFISTVSHELRTPLTSIKGAAEILLNYQDEDQATQTEFLRIIDNESERLTRLINDVLDLSRIESGEMRWTMGPVDIQSVIETAVNSTHAIARRKNVTFEISSDDTLPIIESDNDKLVQVVTNLLSNSIKFTPKGGMIRVNSSSQSELDSSTGLRTVEISVSDNGVGIPSEDLNKIFNRFQQSGSALIDRPQGTGLGLAISKQIVGHLGGEIWVDSKQGVGSTFFFSIPLTQDPVKTELTSDLDERVSTTSDVT